MPRKTIIIFISVFLVIGGGIFIYSRFVSTPTQNTNTTQNGDYRPFGSTTENGSGSISGVISQTINTILGGVGLSSDANRFQKITDFPIAGVTFFIDTRKVEQSQQATNPDGTATQTAGDAQFVSVPSLRFVNRITGHLHQMYLDTKISGVVSNSTIPSIHEALFANNGKTVFYRYLDTDNKTINTFTATLGANRGEFMPDNILNMSVSSDGQKVFYITKDANGVRGAIKNITTAKKSDIWSSPLSEWTSKWGKGETVYLTTKPSQLANGGLWSLNTITGATTKILTGIPGLTTLTSPDGNSVLYSISTTNGPRLGIYSIKKNESTDLSIYGLPEKCIWTKSSLSIYCASPTGIQSGLYPDDWYKGVTSFADRFIRINIDTNTIDTVSEGPETEIVDGTNLILNDTEKILFFTNKKDSALWSLSLE